MPKIMRSVLPQGKLVRTRLRPPLFPNPTVAPKRAKIVQNLVNYDFDEIIEKGNKLAPHMAAMVSRAHYVDLAMKTRNDYMVRIKQMIKAGLLDSKKLNIDQLTDVVRFIDQHSANLRELSLRVALKIADVRKGNKPNWKKIAEVTCCKNIA